MRQEPVCDTRRRLRRSWYMYTPARFGGVVAQLRRVRRVLHAQCKLLSQKNGFIFFWTTMVSRHFPGFETLCRFRESRPQGSKIRCVSGPGRVKSLATNPFQFLIERSTWGGGRNGDKCWGHQNRALRASLAPGGSPMSLSGTRGGPMCLLAPEGCPM